MCLFLSLTCTHTLSLFLSHSFTYSVCFLLCNHFFDITAYWRERSISLCALGASDGTVTIADLVLVPQVQGSP